MSCLLDGLFSAAYYHLYQPAFSSLSKPGSPQPGSPNRQARSSGSLNDAFFVVDYRFDKHFDVYAGVDCLAHRWRSRFRLSG